MIASANKSRRAFTLIELLVVIAVIAVLASLVAVGAIKVIATQRGGNTKNAMATIQKVLNDHWNYVVSDAKKESIDGGPSAKIEQIFGADPTGERTRIIWIKMRLMEAFPISYVEILDKPVAGNSTPFFPYDSGIIPLSMRKYRGVYQKLLPATLQSDNSAVMTPPRPLHSTESAACLLMALSVARNGTSLTVDNLGSATIGDTDGDGIPEFIDAWGTALTFYRFPTDNPDLQSTSPTNSSYHDPLDPSGILLNWKGNLQASQGRLMFDKNVHRIAALNDNTSSAFAVPTLVSAGPDGFILLDLKTMATLPPPAPPLVIPPDANVDNIYSFQVR